MKVTGTFEWDSEDPEALHLTQTVRGGDGFCQVTTTTVSEAWRYTGRALLQALEGARERIRQYEERTRAAAHEAIEARNRNLS